MARDPVQSAGFLVYRIVDNVVEYLLIQSSGRSRSWMAPKGHVEAGETIYQAAARETFEEAGIAEGDLEVDLDCKVELK